MLKKFEGIIQAILSEVVKICGVVEVSMVQVFDIMKFADFRGYTALLHWIMRFFPFLVLSFTLSK